MLYQCEGEYYDEDKLSKDLILQSFGKHQKRNAETLLNYIGDNITWNKTGEIIVNGQVVHYSHIADLLKDSLYGYKDFNPTGYEIFYNALKNVPLTLVKNVKRRSLVGKGRSTFSHTKPLKNIAVPPPPGIPVNVEPIDISTDQKGSGSDWLSNWQKYG